MSLQFLSRCCHTYPSSRLDRSLRAVCISLQIHVRSLQQTANMNPIHVEIVFGSIFGGSSKESSKVRERVLSRKSVAGQPSRELRDLIARELRRLLLRKPWPGTPLFGSCETPKESSRASSSKLLEHPLLQPRGEPMTAAPSQHAPSGALGFGAKHLCR